MTKIGRTKKVICYHDRCGHPVSHETKTGRKYIRVRKKGGGTKRMYEGTRFWSHTKADGKKSWKKLKL